MDTGAAAVEPRASSELDSSSARVHNHLTRLEPTVATILKSQAQILEFLARIQQTLDKDIASDAQTTLAPDVDT